ncbi:MAG: hypothetical protein JW798_18615 [Prolixibacteraceae bacterium]|nr:hypothetical protein [Prolixibacteraceae bacterium]
MKPVKKILIALSLLGGMFLHHSCTQPEGIGGNCHIKGKIMVKYYNDDFSILQFDESTPAKDEDVFLLFGDETVIGEDATTSYTGEFEFNYLWPGNYKLYYYSEDTTCQAPDDVEIVKEITLENKDTLYLNDLLIYKSLDWNEGSSSIKGRVFVTNYSDKNKTFKYSVPAKEQEIYITYGNHEFYDERIRTQDDGTFVFSNLIKGTYRIFMYSRDIAEDTDYFVVEATAEITENNQHFEFEDIFYIDKL